MAARCSRAPAPGRGSAASSACWSASSPGPVWVGLILGGIAIGAAWGAVIGLIAYAATGGRRDFTSLTAIVAERYDVVADVEYAPRARELLTSRG